MKEDGTNGKEVTTIEYKNAEVTQFVNEKGVVTNGAYKLGASIMMMASVIAIVALAWESKAYKKIRSTNR